MLTEVLHQRPGRPSWHVGETKAERVERMRSDAESDSSRWYRDSYPRRVVSMRAVADVESGKLPTLSNMAGDLVRVRVLDLTEDERRAAANGEMKVQGNGLVPVTFDERLGAIAVKLRERHADPEQWERDEEQRVKSEEADNDKQTKDYDRAVEQYRVLKADFPRELHRWSLRADPEETPPAMPERPKAPRIREVYQSSFEREANAIARALPKTQTHTGTGNYFAKETPTQLDRTQSGAPSGQTIIFTTGGLGTADAFIGGFITNVTQGETRAIVSHVDDRAVLEGSLTNWLDTDDLDIFDAWSTIQAAFDQLFTDQGSSAFTAAQYIRVFAGTYDEVVTANAALFPTTNAGFVFEGDPTDSRANVILATTGGTRNYIWNSANRLNVVTQHLSFAGTPTARHIRVLGVNHMIVRDCGFTMTSSVVGVFATDAVTVENCDFVGSGGTSNSEFVFASLGTSIVRNCTFKGENTTSWRAVRNQRSGGIITGCSFSTMLTGTFDVTGHVANNTYYNCATGARLAGSLGATLINNIFSGCGVNLLVSLGWPQQTATEVGPPVTLRNNIYHDYTNFATDGVDFEDFATFTAFNECDEDGDLNNVDPLLTDPGGDDFSLTSSSPAIFAGHGSGVITGINDIVFDKFNPDIGAWSSGVKPTPTQPATPVITATDLLNQSDVRVDIVAGNPLDVSTIFYQTVPGGVLQTWGTTVTGSDSETITGLLVKPYVIYVEAERDGLNSLASNLEFVNIKAANQFTAIRNALREWIKGVVGDPEVIWREPNASQALRPYVSIKMGPTVTIGSDHHGGNDDTGVETIAGDREFVLSVQIHGKPVDEDAGEVISIMERIRSSLEKRSIQATLSAAGLAFRDVEGTGDLSGIGGTQWEARAFKDFRFGITHSDTDDVGLISTVETPVGTYD